MALVAQVLRGCPGRHAWAVYGPPGLARIVTAMTLVVVVELLLERANLQVDRGMAWSYLRYLNIAEQR